MPPEESLTDLYALRRAMRRDLDWPTLHRQAIADGCELAISRDEERIAAVDELLAATLRELVTLGELAGIAGITGGGGREIALGSAALVRLLDRALLAHGRENRYDAGTWRQRTVELAFAGAVLLEQANPEENPLPDTLRRVARTIGQVIVAIPRDRLDVPDLLAYATSDALVIYAAARAH